MADLIECLFDLLTEIPGRFFYKVWRFLTWPFRMVWMVLVWVYKWLISVWRWACK